MNKKQVCLIGLLLMGIVYNSCIAQEKDSSRFELIKLNIPKTELSVSQIIQLWDVFSLLNEDDPDASRRNTIFIRRGRIALKGTAFEKIDFKVQVAYDGVGKDQKLVHFGSSNEFEYNSIFVLWDAYFTYRFTKWFNATFGYFRPQVGRENITSAVYIVDFEKALTNSLPRLHMVGRGNGRESGMNIGGLLGAGFFHINYNLGLFNGTSERIMGSGMIWNPLLSGRLALSIGDPEMEEYGLQYYQSYYGKRKGITIAYNQTYQGETEVFEKNIVRGVDVLLNYGPLDFIAEYDHLVRDTLNGNETMRSLDQVYSLKAYYNMIIFQKRLLTAGYSYTESFEGEEQLFHDIGANLLFYEDKLKIGFHYIWGREKNDDFRYITTGMQVIF